MNYQERAEVIMQRINELASISEDKTCITRTYGTPAFITGRDKVKEWMDKAGLRTSIDTIGNIRGRVSSRNPGAKTFVIGSHIDTVVNAGRFDGPLGVLMGLDLLEEMMNSNPDLPFHIEVVGFCDEEGCRFHTTYLGSQVIAGRFDKAMLNAKDESGISLEEVIKANGSNVNNLSKDAIAGKDWLGYFEIHIEQGPVLYEKDIPVGIVEAIAGQRRFEIKFTGEAGHAGTVPMNMRKDALACASEFILAAEKFSIANKDELVATVGKLRIPHSASNVIPGEVICSLDLRSPDEINLMAAGDELKKQASTICKKRNIGLEWNLIQQSKTVSCDKKMNKILKEAIETSGYQLVELVSGAGHDAVAVSAVSPVAMMFVRCFKGISHHPEENVEIKDIAAAIKVSDQFIKYLLNTHYSN
jgi:hydantoinase/carbamoylase family amidase